MKKIISLFQRNYDGDRLVRNEIVPGAEWVIAGEGVATRKWDGTCCLVRDGKLYKRYDAKQGKKPPANFEPAQDYDPITGHMPGWIPVGDGPEDAWHRDAFANMRVLGWPVQTTGMKLPISITCELVGPKIGGNPEDFSHHTLIPHGNEPLADCPRDFDGIKAYLASKDIEGIVWHHPDGRMVKIKTKDFGLKRGRLAAA